MYIHITYTGAYIHNEINVIDDFHIITLNKSKTPKGKLFNVKYPPHQNSKLSQIWLSIVGEGRHSICPGYLSMYLLSLVT